MSEYRPPASVPTCWELACAPELGILTAIETTLDVAIVALTAAQPDLQPTDDPYGALCATATAADHIMVCAQRLAAAIAAYRAALNDPPQDLPF